MCCTMFPQNQMRIKLPIITSLLNLAKVVVLYTRFNHYFLQLNLTTKLCFFQLNSITLTLYWSMNYIVEFKYNLNLSIIREEILLCCID